MSLSGRFKLTVFDCDMSLCFLCKLSDFFARNLRKMLQLILQLKLFLIYTFFSVFSQLLKEYPFPGGLNIHENLIEALLEMQAYSEVQVSVHGSYHLIIYRL